MARCRAIVPHFRIYISVYISSHIFHYICLYSPRISSYILQANCNSSLTKYLPWHTNAHIYCIYEYIFTSYFHLYFFLIHSPSGLYGSPYISLYISSIFPFSIYFCLYFFLIHSPFGLCKSPIYSHFQYISTYISFSSIPHPPNTGAQSTPDPPERSSWHMWYTHLLPHPHLHPCEVHVPHVVHTSPSSSLCGACGTHISALPHSHPCST